MLDSRRLGRDSVTTGGTQAMRTPLFQLLGVVVTPWKLVGYLGIALFAGRWVVQVLATRRHGRPVIPALFWIMSVSGSLLLVVYFIWGKNDSVGVLSNLFPMSVALYNLALHRRLSDPPAEPPSATIS